VNLSLTREVVWMKDNCGRNTAAAALVCLYLKTIESALSAQNGRVARR
jgi:hypothetical protein